MRLKKGTVMYSEDWLDQCVESWLIPIEQRKLVMDICEYFQSGSSLDPIMIWNLLKAHSFHQGGVSE